MPHNRSLFMPSLMHLISQTTYDLGPVLGSVQKSNMSVRTYNCNGLGVIDKFRRILAKIRGETGSGGIVLLQETHIKNDKIIDTYWKGGYVSSFFS